MYIAYCKLTTNNKLLTLKTKKEMETLKNEPVILGGSTSNDSGLTDAVVLSTFLNRRGFGDEGRGTGFATEMATLLNQQQLGEVQRDIKSTESGIRETILNQTIGTNSEFRSVDGKLFSIDKEALRANYEAQISALKATNELSNKIDYKTEHLASKINSLEVGMDKQFSSLKERLISGLDKVKEREQLREIEGLRRQNDQLLVKNSNEDLIRSMLSSLKITGIPA